ncbi:MAG TPA: ATP-binding protein [Phycisphaerae bacterium]|nr:ATP-binding protein [Phycisphaerae bacterium]HNU45969.1 ATP-binding protein [Phycisphaerae bacterium]
MNPLTIGRIINVESGCVEVQVTSADRQIEHEGQTYRIGQLGSYLTIPGAERRIVAFVVSSHEHPAPREDATSELRLQAQLIGEIRGDRFVRGVNEYPIIGDEVCQAVRADFAAIFGSFDQRLSGSAHPMSFTLGRFALNPEFDVKVMGTDFLAKHVAVLGNSGAGKSCTTTRILDELTSLGAASIVMFDMHGEYRAAFTDAQGKVDPNVVYVGAEDLVLPYWLLKYEELEALFVDRSNPLHISTQISFLRTALLEFKQDAARELGLTKTLTLDTPIYFSLDKLKNYAENLNEARYVLNSDHLAFTQLALRSLPPQEQQKLMRTQRCSFNRGNPEGETQHPLYFGRLLGLIDAIDTKYSDRRYEFLLRPLEHSQRSRFFKEKITAEDTAGQASGLMNDLIRLMTGRGTPRTNLTIIDLSGIPFEIVDVTVAVLTRLLFDLNFWTPAPQRHPILLMFEEAHNYIPRIDNGRDFARRAVERVAKEGRKYGVSAMVISQRPSELSETVLAQCNNLVVMRLNNPEDQHYVRKVVGDNFASLIDMLPILRPGEAFVIGDSVLMPMRTLVNIPARLPASGNLDFFRLWSAAAPESSADIDAIIDHWRRQNRQHLEGGESAAASKPAAAKATVRPSHPAFLNPVRPAPTTG